MHVQYYTVFWIKVNMILRNKHVDIAWIHSLTAIDTLFYVTSGKPHSAANGNMAAATPRDMNII